MTSIPLPGGALGAIAIFVAILILLKLRRGGAAWQGLHLGNPLAGIQNNLPTKTGWLVVMLAVLLPFVAYALLSETPVLTATNVFLMMKRAAPVIAIISCVIWALAVAFDGWTKGIRDTLLLFTVVLGAMIFVLYVIEQRESESQQVATAQARATAAQTPPMLYVRKSDTYDWSSWPTVTLPPGGRSVEFKLAVGSSPLAANMDVKIHCVYQDKHEGIVGDTTSPCHDGPMTGVYITNGTDKTQEVPYAFAR